MKTIEALIRPNILALEPYSSARDEFSGTASIFLDANESLGPLLSAAETDRLHRYPDARQLVLKTAIAASRKVDPSQVFLGNGSDECIDLLYRCFCEPARDNVIVCPPTYGMYSVNAAINNVAVREVALDSDFQLDMEGIMAATDENTRLLWLCSPNNPTGNVMQDKNITFLLENFPGIVVVDEAYIDFADARSLVQSLDKYPRLVVLQTFSKAWALAGLRLGVAYASSAAIAVLDKVKPPYNIGTFTQRLAAEALLQADKIKTARIAVTKERERLARNLSGVSVVRRVYPSDANFLLVEVEDSKAVYCFLLDHGIVVRDRSGVKGCENCLRITVGATWENNALIEVLSKYNK